MWNIAITIVRFVCLCDYEILYDFGQQYKNLLCVFAHPNTKSSSSKKNMMNRFIPNGQFKTNSIVIIVKCINFETTTTTTTKVKDIFVYSVALYDFLREMKSLWNQWCDSKQRILYNGYDVLLHLICTLIHSRNKFFGIVPFRSCSSGVCVCVFFIISLEKNHSSDAKFLWINASSIKKHLWWR